MKLPVTESAIKRLKERIERDIEYTNCVEDGNSNWRIHLSLDTFKKNHDVTILEVDDILKRIGFEKYSFLNHLSW